MKRHMNILGLIPARGGSKGIPQKNIISLGGHPLISYTIKAALCSKSVGRVVVSSDDSKIISISEKCGAETIKRPEEFSGDMSPIDKTILHSMRVLKKTKNYVPDLIVLLQPTSPFRTPKTIDFAVKSFVANINHFDSLIPLCKFEGKIGKIKSKKYFPLCHNPGQQRQEVESLFKECGTIFIFKPELIQAGKFHGDRIFPFLIRNTREALDIDSYHDFNVANYFLKYEK